MGGTVKTSLQVKFNSVHTKIDTLSVVKSIEYLAWLVAKNLTEIAENELHHDTSNSILSWMGNLLRLEHRNMAAQRPEGWFGCEV